MYVHVQCECMALSLFAVSGPSLHLVTAILFVCWIDLICKTLSLVISVKLMS